MKSLLSKIPRYLRFLMTLILGFSGGYLIANGLGQPYKPIEEAKLCYLALTRNPSTLQPQTREYLKGRLYWNAALWISPGWLDGWHIDFGPVDDNILGGLKYIKDASSSTEIYEAALRRHPRSASSNKPE